MMQRWGARQAIGLGLEAWGAWVGWRTGHSARYAHDGGGGGRGWTADWGVNAVHTPEIARRACVRADGRVVLDLGEQGERQSP